MRPDRQRPELQANVTQLRTQTVEAVQHLVHQRGGDHVAGLTCAKVVCMVIDRTSWLELGASCELPKSHRVTS